MRSTREQVLRFALLGGVNTVATGALVALLSLVMQPQVAYTIAFAVGLAVNATLTGRLVFGGSDSPAQRWAYAAWYVAVYLVGIALLTAAGAERGSPWAGLVVLVLSIALAVRQTAISPISRLAPM